MHRAAAEGQIPRRVRCPMFRLQTAPPAPGTPYGQAAGAPYQEPRREPYRDRGYHQDQRPRKKENWLSDLFD